MYSFVFFSFSFSFFDANKLLMFSTLVLGLHFWQMKFSVILNTTLRTILADYSLPLAVLIISFFGSFVFRKITSMHPHFLLLILILNLVAPFSYHSGSILVLSDMGDLPVWAIFLAMVFGIMLSLLFFMDQNVSSALAASKDILYSFSPLAFYIYLLFWY